MVYFVESQKDGTEYGNIDVLVDGISLGQEYGTVLGYSAKVVGGKVNILKVKVIIWILYLYPIKDPEMTIFMIH